MILRLLHSIVKNALNLKVQARLTPARQPRSSLEPTTGLEPVTSFLPRMRSTD